METDISKSIAYLHMMSFEQNRCFRGGVLVTDTQTYPQEFRLTSPIRPTSLQAMLYGSTMENYIGLELIAMPLIKALVTKPVLVVVNIPFLLRAREKSDTPMVLLDVTKKEFIYFPTCKNDLNIAIDLFQEPDFEKLLEPFNRIEVALSEAHEHKVGEA